MGKGFFRGIVGILWRVIKAQSIQLIWALESIMAVVETVFRVVGETMTVMGIYRDCFLQFLDFGITTKGADGVEGGEICGAAEDGDV